MYDVYNKIIIFFALCTMHMIKVVRNFMSNALKFTPPEGMVTVTVKVSYVLGPEEHGSEPATLSEEEAILIVNSQFRDPTCAFKGDKIALKSVQGMKGSFDAHDGAEDQDKDGAVHQPEDDHESSEASRSKDLIVVVDGKKYQEHAKVIVSFVDTGAGISMVLPTLTSTTCTMYVTITNNARLVLKQENQPKVFRSIVQFNPDELQNGAHT
jgi:signal transduction histidine kinase